MFYIREQTENGEARFDITNENVYTTCPWCGCEHQIDLAEVFGKGERIDLLGTAIYCEACSKKKTATIGADRRNFDERMDELMAHYLDAANHSGPNSPEAKAAGERLKEGLLSGQEAET